MWVGLLVYILFAALLSCFRNLCQLNQSVMNELILFIIVAAVFLAGNIVTRSLKAKQQLIVRLIASVLLLGLIWFFAGNGKISVKVIMTVILVSGLLISYRSYRQASDN